MSERKTNTGGREATLSVIPGKFALSVGKPRLPEPAGFRWTMLTDVARIESGHTPSRAKEEYWNGPIPWIGIREATRNHGKTIYETSQSITELGLNNSSTRLLPAETVCLSRTASVGYVVKMGVPMATSQDFVNWVSGPEMSPTYLMYILMAEQDSVRRFSHGTTHQTMYYPEAKALNVLIPPRPEQDWIVEVLGALDSKIAANNKLIAKTDELSQTLFRSMSSSESQLAPLSDTAQFVNGKAFTKNASGTGRVVIRIAELNSGIGTSTVYNDIQVDAQHVAHPGDLLFAWSGSLTLHRWFRPEAIVNQHIFKVIPNDDYPHWLVYELLRHKLEEFKAIAADKATTMGHIQRKHLDELVVVPASEIIRSHNEVMTGLWEQALAAEVESLKLADTRDALLPQLLSGKLRVKDAKKILENAGV